MNPRISPAKLELFLTELRRVPNVARACRIAEFSTSTAKKHREITPGFAEAWDEAWDIGVQAVELECYRRAVEGVEEPVFHQGIEVSTVRKYSDGLLTRLLESLRPDRWRAKADLAISGNVALQVITGLPEAIVDSNTETAHTDSVDDYL